MWIWNEENDLKFVEDFVFKMRPTAHFKKHFLIEKK